VAPDTAGGGGGGGRLVVVAVELLVVVGVVVGVVGGGGDGSVRGEGGGGGGDDEEGVLGEGLGLGLGLAVGGGVELKVVLSWRLARRGSVVAASVRGMSSTVWRSGKYFWRKSCKLSGVAVLSRDENEPASSSTSFGGGPWQGTLCRRAETPNNVNRTSDPATTIRRTGVRFFAPVGRSRRASCGVLEAQIIFSCVSMPIIRPYSKPSLESMIGWVCLLNDNLVISS
jgi:hypothetical protein